MTLTEKEREKIEKNIGLVHKVIRDKLQPPYQVGMYSYEDLFQIGCIGPVSYTHLDVYKRQTVHHASDPVCTIFLVLMKVTMWKKC